MSMKTISIELSSTSVLVIEFPSINFIVAHRYVLVIQGIADPITRSKLSEDELQRMIEFCARGFEATDPDERAHVLNHATMRKDGLIVTDDLAADANPDSETSKDGSTDENWLRVARALNARKFLRTEDIQHIDNLIGDTLNGMKIHLKIGELGLISA